MGNIKNKMESNVKEAAMANAKAQEFDDDSCSDFNRDTDKIAEVHRIVSSDHTLKVGPALFRELKEVIQVFKGFEQSHIQLVHSRAIDDRIHQRRSKLVEDVVEEVVDYVNFPTDDLYVFESDWKASWREIPVASANSKLCPWINSFSAALPAPSQQNSLIEQEHF